MSPQYEIIIREIFTDDQQSVALLILIIFVWGLLMFGPAFEFKKKIWKK
jgi:hypothetical protein